MVAMCHLSCSALVGVSVSVAVVILNPMLFVRRISSLSGFAGGISPVVQCDFCSSLLFVL